MRILFLAAYKSPEFLEWDGKQDSFLGGLRKIPAVIRALLLAGHEVRVVSSAVSVASSWRRQPRMETTVTYPEGTIRVVHVGTTALKPWGGLWACVAARREALKAAREWKPDVAFAFNGLLAEAMGLLAIDAQLGIPLVVEVDDYVGVRVRGLNPKPKLDRLGWKALEPRVSGFAIITKSLVEKINCGDRPWMLLPGAVDEAVATLALQRREPFGGPTRRVMYSGGLSPNRGADRLLAAIDFLPDNWQLVLSGAGPLEPAFLEAQRKNPARVHCLGFVAVERMYQELFSVDATINTPEQLTDQGGVFPFKVFDYILSGSHLISTPVPDVGGPSFEWFQRWDGTPAQLGAVLQRAEADYAREKQVRETGRKWVLENFSLAGIGRNLDRVLREAVQRKKAGR